MVTFVEIVMFRTGWRQLSRCLTKEKVPFGNQNGKNININTKTIPKTQKQHQQHNTNINNTKTIPTTQNNTTNVHSIVNMLIHKLKHEIIYCHIKLKINYTITHDNRM